MTLIKNREVDGVYYKDYLNNKPVKKTSKIRVLLALLLFIATVTLLIVAVGELS